MKLPRPHIPLAVRVEVARRQAEAAGLNVAWTRRLSKTAALGTLLRLLFGNQPVQLDHDPPLAARSCILRRGLVVGFRPAASNPDFLVYRTAEDHRVKTLIRGEHGQHPDRVLIKKKRRLERCHCDERTGCKGWSNCRAKRGYRYRWPSRPFAQRKMRPCPTPNSSPES